MTQRRRAQLHPACPRPCGRPCRSLTCRAQLACTASAAASGTQPRRLERTTLLLVGAQFPAPPPSAPRITNHGCGAHFRAPPPCAPERATSPHHPISLVRVSPPSTHRVRHQKLIINNSTVQCSAKIYMSANYQCQCAKKSLRSSATKINFLST